MTTAVKGQRPVKALLSASAPDLEAIRARFDALSVEGRVAEMMQLKAKEQAALFELTRDHEPLDPKELVKDAGERTVIWEGVNSLPMFRRFQKRVVKEQGADDGSLLSGYNEQAMRWVTGPGCFTVRRCRDDEPGSIVFDYTITPKRVPAGCPKVLRADRGLSRFVYGGMCDYMHRVTDDVLIGRAWIRGKQTGNYFLLTRGATV